MITIPEAKPLAYLLRAQVESLQLILTAGRTSIRRRRKDFAPVHRKPGDIGFLQYTSGSTGSPKGVVLSHANLMANVRAMGAAVQRQPDGRVRQLAAAVPRPGPDRRQLRLAVPRLSDGADVAARLPVAARELDARHPPPPRHACPAARISPSSCACAASHDEDMEGLDLSSWRFAFNAAEPVSPDTIVEFEKRFAKWGLRRTACRPSTAWRSPRSAWRSRCRARRGARIASTASASRAPGEAAEARRGRSLAAHRHRLRHADSGARHPRRRCGRARTARPAGRAAAVPRAVVHLAATTAIPRRPRRCSAATTGSTPATAPTSPRARCSSPAARRTSSSAAGATSAPTSWSRRWATSPACGAAASPCSAATMPPPAPSAWWCWRRCATRTACARTTDLRRMINDLAVSLIGAPADDIVLAPPAHRAQDLQRQDPPRRRARVLRARAAGGGGRRGVAAVRAPGAGRRRAAAAPLAAHAAGALFALRVARVRRARCPSRLAALRCRRPRAAGASAAVSTMRFLRLVAASRLPCGGRKTSPRTAPVVLAVNHTSYLDALVLLAALLTTAAIAFVAKREFQDNFLMRALLLRGFGTQFIERFDIAKSAEHAGELAEAARGAALADRLPGRHAHAQHRPDGVSHRRLPGRRAGRRPGGAGGAARRALGAARRHLVPARAARSPSVLARRSRPRARTGPRRSTLRDAVRAEILRHCGEPDLAPRASRAQRRN